ncbi:MAG: type II secretion system minor pseudopilin GspJ [Gammaproteobacteria bacterium]|nr:type II secretion system minor pseudopilin GspJ [Gammaproteobacteria bacterium]
MRNRGFTLLELLVALAIFAVLATTTYGGLLNILGQRAAVEQQAERLQALQLTYRLLGRELAQISTRGIRDIHGDPQPALQLGGQQPGLEFTHGGWLNPAERPRAVLQRVRYVLDQDRLLRFSWQVLDRAQDSEPVEQRLLEEVRELRVRLLDENNEWHEQWPPEALLPGQPLPAAPRAAEVILELDDLGELRWLFRLAI